MPTKLSEAEFVAAWNATGSPIAVANATGLTIRAIYERRARLAQKGIHLLTVSTSPRRDTEYSTPLQFERRRRFEIQDGVVVVFSDPHWMPDHSTTGQDALERVIKELKPKLVVLGGDAGRLPTRALPADAGTP